MPTSTSSMTYGVEPGSGLAVLLDWLARPYDSEKVMSALLGLPPRVTRQLIGTVIATSDEAEDLLEAMPRILRALAIATTDTAERCVGEIRGPVLWAETMSARSCSAGDPGLFVCATTTKAYDTDENRVLKAALDLVCRAGRDAEHGMDTHAHDVVRRARHNGQQAARLLDHQTLASVVVSRPTGRALRRTRAGNRRHTYRPALALLRRASDPVGATHVEALADERTGAQLDLLAAVLQHLEDVTGTSPVLRADHGGLTAGPITFHHPDRPGDRDQPAGITIGDVLLDVPDPLGSDPERALVELEARAGERRAILALGITDVEQAVAVARAQPSA